MKTNAILVGLLVSVGMAALPTAAQSAAPEKHFMNPPDSAKPSCYWWWLNANVDKEAITRDVEAFSAKGIGSVLLVSSRNWGGPNVARGPAFLSNEWRELFKFALKEANRVGIKVDVNMPPGWNMGGPWGTPASPDPMPHVPILRDLAEAEWHTTPIPRPSSPAARC